MPDTYLQYEELWFSFQIRAVVIIEPPGQSSASHKDMEMGVGEDRVEPEYVDLDVEFHTVRGHHPVVLGFSSLRPYISLCTSRSNKVFFPFEFWQDLLDVRLIRNGTGHTECPFRCSDGCHLPSMLGAVGENADNGLVGSKM